MKRNLLKKSAAIMSASLLSLSILSCSTALPVFAAENTAEASSAGITAADLTFEKILDALTPATILKNNKIYSLTYSFENTGDELLDSMTQKSTVLYENNYYYINEVSEYSDGYVTNIYYSSEPGDPNMYVASPEGNEVFDLEEGYVGDYIYQSLLVINEETSTLNVSESGDTLIAEILTTEGDDTIKTYVTFDKKSGTVLNLSTEYPSVKSDEITKLTVAFNYDKSLQLDKSAKGDGSAAITPSSDNAESTETVQKAGNFKFETTDINGNPVTEEMLEGAKLVLVNFWEPWCGPCVREIPDLEKIYEKYKDKGLVVLGVYSAFQMQSDAEDIIASNGVTYPVIKCDENLKKYMKDYVPYTLFIDENGNVIENEDYGGSKDFAGWEAIINSFGITE